MDQLNKFHPGPKDCKPHRLHCEYHGIIMYQSLGINYQPQLIDRISSINSITILLHTVSQYLQC